MAANLGAPLLPQHQAQLVGNSLTPSQTGGIDLPMSAYTSDVLCWARRLSKRDYDAIQRIVVHKGFTEDAYRFVFAYEGMYEQPGQHKYPKLVTLLPNGTVETNKGHELHPEPEKCLLAYAWQQDVLPAVFNHNQVGPASKFVFIRKNEKYGLVQTWPGTYNADFKSSFKIVAYPNNPSPEHFPDPQRFDAAALEDFKKVMIDLFNLSDVRDEELPIKFAYKHTENDDHVYFGTGRELMSLLRLCGSIRKEMDIIEVVEPDGFVSRITYPPAANRKPKRKPFHMDITLPYCLYVKRGFETMACVKPEDQFNKECQAGDKVQDRLQQLNALSCPMDIDWFSKGAYLWALRGAGVVWGCAFLNLFAFFAGREDLVASMVHYLIAVVAVAYGVKADSQAMKYLLVPWLQKVKKLKIFITIKDFDFFLKASLLSTAIQIFTIQANTWFMVETVKLNDENVFRDWKLLWTKSWFGIYLSPPDWMWNTIITPAKVALFCWVLSIGQLVVPLLVSIPYHRPKNTFPNNDQVPKDFEPEAHYCDFWTYWGMVHKKLGGYAKKCTYRESVSSLAWASGLRYTLSTSISYPSALIGEIIKSQQGYRLFTSGLGFEPLSYGWEMRSLVEFRKIRKMLVRRVIFIMLCKLAMQANLQITLLIIQLHHKKSHIYYDTSQERWRHAWKDWMGGDSLVPLFRIVILIISVGLELWDLANGVFIFCRVRAAVLARMKHAINPGWCPCCRAVDLEQTLYAHDDFILIEDGKDRDAKHGPKPLEKVLVRKGTMELTKSDGAAATAGAKEELVQVSRITYTYKHLWNEYRCARKSMLRIAVLTAFSMWLIVYAILKFFGTVRCKSGLWTFMEGCLPEDVTNQ